MGSAASTFAFQEMNAALDNASIAANVFAMLDANKTGMLTVERLVQVAKEHFDSQPTTQPESWIRSIINGYDDDCDGALSEEEFANAIDSLRRC